MDAAIRSRRTADLEPCARLLAAVHVAHRYPVHWPDDPVSWLRPADLSTAWVAVLDGEVVGHVCLTTQPDAAPLLAVERLFVSPASARRGIGEALLQTAAGWAARRQLPLTLEVADNCASAIALYERLGWRRTGATGIDWGDGVATSVLHFTAPPR